MSDKQSWEKVVKKMQERGDVFHRLAEKDQRAIRRLVEKVDDVLSCYQDVLDVRTGDMLEMENASYRADNATDEIEAVCGELASAVAHLAAAARAAANEFRDGFELYGSDLRALLEAVWAVRHLIDFTPTDYQREQMAKYGVTPPSWNN